MYKCDKCCKEFKYNYLLTRHINKKKSCDIIGSVNNKEIILADDKINKFMNINIKNIDNKIKIIDRNIEKTNKKINKETDESLKNNKCLFCDKIFLKKYNLSRHIKKYCLLSRDLFDSNNNLLIEKDKLLIEKDKLLEEEKNKQRDNELKMLRMSMAKLLKKQSANINIVNNKIINNNNKIINNNVVVNINSFGNENLSHITNKDYKKFLSGFFPGFIQFIEKIHFDENVPENQNVCITNLKSKYMYIFENGKWAIKERNELIDKFIAKKYNLLVDKLDELEENNEIDEKTLEKFNRFSKNYQDIEAQKNTKNDVMLMIYNNKDKINMKS
jgi:hypothetical protein